MPRAKETHAVFVPDLASGPGLQCAELSRQWLEVWAEHFVSGMSRLQLSLTAVVHRAWVISLLDPETC
jgi:hypothetical protein